MCSTSKNTKFMLLLPIVIYFGLWWPIVLGMECDGVLASASVCVPQDYFKSSLPKPLPVQVLVDFTIVDIPNVDDKAQTVICDMEISLYWNETRLLLELSEIELTEGFAALPPSGLDLLWKPDLTIDSLVNFQLKHVLDPEQGVHITPADKTVHFWFKARLTLSCKMEFSTFPMDAQICTILMRSSNYNHHEIQFRINDETREGGEHKLQNFDVEVREFAKPDGSSVGVNLHLERHTSSFMLRYYLPCIAIVMVSQISFLIPPEAIPGRSALLVTLFLVQTNMFTSQQAETPPSSSLTALATYMLTCLLFIFSAMLEFAFLLYHKRRAEYKAQISATANKVPTVGPGGRGRLAFLQMAKSSDPKMFASVVDNVSLVIFFIAFLLFNLIYCVYYSRKKTGD